MLKEDRTSESLGEETLMSISHAEMLDSDHIFQKYLTGKSDKTELEEGQLLVFHSNKVYTENSGFKVINAPLSILLWARKKHHRTVCLIRPTYKQVIAELAERLSLAECFDLAELAVFVNVIDTMVWLNTHSKVGCKYCNKSADFQYMPSLFDSLRHTRVGNQKISVGEEYMAKRIMDLIRLPGNKGKTHDVIVHKSMLASLVRELFKQEPRTSDPELTKEEYIKRLAEHSATKYYASEDKIVKLSILSHIMSKNDALAEEEILDSQHKSQVVQGCQPHIKTIVNIE